jgi:hypothetical protein
LIVMPADTTFEWPPASTDAQNLVPVWKDIRLLRHLDLQPLACTREGLALPLGNLNALASEKAGIHGPRPRPQHRQ